MRSILSRLAVTAGLMLTAGFAHAQAAKPPATPAEALGGLTAWKIALPLDEDGNNRADEIKQPTLATADRPPYFTLSPNKDGVLFRAIAGGARTSTGTAYARSELREMSPDGTVNAAWDCVASKRGMYIEQTLLHSTVGKPEATIAQIHDAKNDNLMVKYTGPMNGNGSTDRGKIEVRFNNDTMLELLDSAYTLGDPMTLDIDVNEGKMVVAYKNLKTGVSKTTRAVPFENVIGGCYFKAGMYIQACSLVDIYGKPNAQCEKKGWPAHIYDKPEAYSEVLIRKLTLR